MKYLKLFESNSNAVDHLFSIINKETFPEKSWQAEDDDLRISYNRGTREDPDWDVLLQDEVDLETWNALYLLGAGFIDSQDQNVSIEWGGNKVEQLLLKPLVPEIERRAKEILIEKIETNIGLYNNNKELFNELLGDDFPDWLKRGGDSGLFDAKIKSTQ